MLCNDLGGGTFDISIVQVSSSKMEILCSNGEKKLGGIDFDKALKETVEEKFEEVAIDDELESQDYSNWTAEQDKKALSMRDKLTIRVNRETIDITRYEFEEAISLYINQAERLCESTIEEAGLKVSDIHAVLCVGGSTRVPYGTGKYQERFRQGAYF